MGDDDKQSNAPRSAKGQPSGKRPNPARAPNGPAPKPPIVVDRHGKLVTPETEEAERRAQKIGLAVLAIIAAVVVVSTTKWAFSDDPSSTNGHPTAAPTSSGTPTLTVPFVVTEANVGAAVRDALRNTTPPIDGAPNVTCAPDGDWCQIEYTVKRPVGFSSDRELVAPTRAIWRQLFSDPRFTSGTMVVSGPTTTVGAKAEVSVLFTLTCDRRAASQVDWNIVEGKGIRELCDYHAAVNGL